jgi:hypothetical protein
MLCAFSATTPCLTAPAWPLTRTWRTRSSLLQRPRTREVVGCYLSVCADVLQRLCARQVIGGPSRSMLPSPVRAPLPRRTGTRATASLKALPRERVKAKVGSSIPVTAGAAAAGEQAAGIELTMRPRGRSQRVAVSARTQSQRVVVTALGLRISCDKRLWTGCVPGARLPGMHVRSRYCSWPPLAG